MKPLSATGPRTGKPTRCVRLRRADASRVALRRDQGAPQARPAAVRRRVEHVVRRYRVEAPRSRDLAVTPSQLIAHRSRERRSGSVPEERLAGAAAWARIAHSQCSADGSEGLARSPASARCIEAFRFRSAPAAGALTRLGSACSLSRAATARHTGCEGVGPPKQDGSGCGVRSHQGCQSAPSGFDLVREGCALLVNRSLNEGQPRASVEEIAALSCPALRSARNLAGAADVSPQSDRRPGSQN